MKNESLLQILCALGQLDRALDALSHMDIGPASSNIYLSLLKACNRSKALTEAKQVHAHIFRHGAQLTGFLGDYLVLTLARCGAIEDALHTSRALPCRTVFSWTAIISAYTESGQGQEALRMYQCMLEDGVEPDKYTFVSLFKACGSIPDIGKGKTFHAEARSKGFTSDAFVGNTLVSMYGKCGAFVEAGDVFRALSHHDVVSWNAMLSAYVEQGQGENTLHLYRQMQEEGMSPNPLTFVITLHACGTLAEKEEALVAKKQSVKVMALEIGRALRADAHKKGYTSNVLVGNTLVSMYGKCRTIVEAEDTFCAMSRCDIVSWNAMLSAYVEQGQEEKALQLFIHMQEEGETPKELTYVVCLHACATLAEREEALVVKGRSTKVISLEIGHALHADFCKKGLVLDTLVGNALVTMYGKCGTLAEAKNVFGELSLRDIVSWTTMLSTYVDQGQAKEALLLYRHMQKQHVCLDDVTLICILQACIETGSLETCKEIHFSVVSAGYERIPSVAGTLVHAYGSCASMVDGQAFFDELFEPDAVPWTVCIAGHAGEGNSAASLHMFENLKLAGIRPDEVMFTSALLACSHSGLVAKGLEYLECMSKEYGVTPNLKHFSIIIDLLGRAGDFKRVENMLEQMPMQADLTIWLCLLGACQKHCNIELARQAFDHAVKLEPRQAASYVLMSNIYADAGLHECAAEVENFRQKQGAWALCYPCESTWKALPELDGT